VELALILVILLLLLSGIFDLGRAIFTQFALQDSAEEGLVYGIAFPGKCGEIEQRVRDNLQNSILPSNPPPTVSIKIDSNACVEDATNLVYGKPMDVIVSSTFVISMPFLSGNTITLRGTANGTILRPPPVVTP